MVALVTGGSGFIGSHVVNELLKDGYQVRVFDKLPPQNDKAEWFKGDLLSKENIHDCMHDIETVFHLGAIADVNVAVSDPDLCLLVNECGTLNLLRSCTGQEVDRVVLASTVWVCGRANATVTESQPIPSPTDIYTKTKIGQEHLVNSWCLSHSLQYTILRYDIPYGPGMRTNTAIASFVRRAERKEPITIFGDGRQGRCWIFVTDLARGHSLALKETAANEILNLAGSEFVTVSEIVDQLKKLFGNLSIKYEPPRASDFGGVHTSIEKAEKLVAWKPEIRFSDGLSRYIQSVRRTQRPS